jgi:alkanesulfonate monooxygenase SsuD/methylene tetrahydromethanopterin reductase-like flavin-dependent oxidoreductase (luciferase family)
MAWTQDEVTFKGKFWQFDEAFTMPKPYQRPHPPIWVAAHSLRSVEFAVQQGYDIAQSINVDQEMAAKFQHFHEQWAKVWPQRPPARKFILRSVIVAETDAKAEELGRQYVQNMFPWGIERLRETRIGTGTSQYITGPDDTPENRARRQVMAECRKSYEFAIESGCAVVGSPETVARRIREQSALMGGIDVYACDFQVGPMDPGMVERSMTLFGRHVIPALVNG